MTLCNSETADSWSHLCYPIDSLGIGENRQVIGMAVVNGLSYAVDSLGQTWSCVLTTPQGIALGSTYFTVEEKVIPTPTPHTNSNKLSIIQKASTSNLHCKCVRYTDSRDGDV